MGVDSFGITGGERAMRLLSASDAFRARTVADVVDAIRDTYFDVSFYDAKTQQHYCYFNSDEMTVMEMAPDSDYPGFLCQTDTYRSIDLHCPVRYLGTGEDVHSFELPEGIM